jgi:isocitrate dehydrogenase
LEHEYRYLRKGINYAIEVEDPEISFVMKELMFLATEGERRVLIYEILPSEG